jgi:hypothetical protein
MTPLNEERYTHSFLFFVFFSCYYLIGGDMVTVVWLATKEDTSTQERGHSSDSDAE